MKTLILTAALSLLACAAQAQDQQSPPKLEIKKAGSVDEKPEGTAYLGIKMEKSEKGLMVDAVEKGSSAAKAGLEAGAILTGIDGISVEGNPDVVVKVVRGKKPGDEIELQWRTARGEGAARITLGSRPVEEPFSGEKKSFDKKPAESGPKSDKGKDFEPVPAGERRGFRYTPEPNVRPLPPAKKQLRDLPPEVQADPYKDVKEKELRFKKVDPYGDPEKDLLLETPRRLRDLEVVPFRDLDNIDLRKSKYLLLEEDRRDGELPRDWEKRFVNPSAKPAKKRDLDEKAVWDRVQKQVAGALKKAGLDDGVRAKVMQALEDAQRHESETEARQAKLEAEIQKLEKASKDLQDRAKELRQELKKAATE
ncbi:MAG TPA: PDZ domain-containing protein [Verrucomicrobiales bacterium]|nr:PDZ domain-containing protein [Verrucomicrobiales bacterium]